MVSISWEISLVNFGLRLLNGLWISVHKIVILLVFLDALSNYPNNCPEVDS